MILCSLLLFVTLAVLAIYRLGGKSQQVKDLKSDLKTSEKSNDVLQKQRDNRVDSVDSADSFWLRRKAKKD